MLSTSPRSILISLALLFAVSATASELDRGLRSTLRIRLLEQLHPTRVEVQTTASDLRVMAGADEALLFTVPASTPVRISIRRGEIKVEADGRTAIADQIKLASMSGNALSVSYGTHNSRSYQGDLVISTDEGRELKLINHVPLEAYVASVVASEYGLDDLEGSKAMAVIARTYALKAIKTRDDSYDHVDHTLSQVYRGAGEVTARSLEAAMLTSGEVLTHNGSLIEAVYSSSSGGHTANNETVWSSNAFPYLRGKNDPWDSVSPHHNWTFDIDEKELRLAIRDAYGLDLDYLEVADRSPDGRAASIRLVPHSGRSRELSANELRIEFSSRFGIRSLRSTLFDVRRRNGVYTFEGHGFGHGVGLSQWGAHAMALDGRDYDEILAFYYSGVRLEDRSADSDVEAAISFPSLASNDAANSPEDRFQAPVRTSSPAAPAVQSAESVDAVPATRSKRPRRRLGW